MKGTPVLEKEGRGGWMVTCRASCCPNHRRSSIIGLSEEGAHELSQNVVSLGSAILVRSSFFHCRRIAVNGFGYSRPPAILGQSKAHLLAEICERLPCLFQFGHLKSTGL